MLVTSYPFNAFLGASVSDRVGLPDARRFSSTVGQFVLLASLRIQANPANKAVFRDIAPERSDAPAIATDARRAFAEFVFSSIVLHAFVFTFLCVLRSIVRIGSCPQSIGIAYRGRRPTRTTSVDCLAASNPSANAIQ